ncbi:MAG: LuxR C-terminal-related transcriptional regulator [Firmicutes bacterium]|nr:LuxR C-terminal-related transcriptional regulator [Bacillota bacterium]MDY3993057.1 LuxR C-terminal-related transcriptional regulator [Evtepia sp.]
MEKNDFLLCNEVIYHIHTCGDLDELKRTILAQVKLLIPYTYASIIAVEIDPETKAIHHSDPFCLPDSFTALEHEWIARDYQDESLWVSHAPESIVVRNSEIMGEENRLTSPIYRDLYVRYNIYDSLTMNLAYNHQVMALMTLYRTRADGVFTDQEAFFLRALSLHVNYAYFMMSRRENRRASASRTLEELTAAYRLTRREEEILGMVFREQSNDEILDQLAISRHTLHKHLQNLYRKCGVSSRLGLLKLRTG